MHEPISHMRLVEGLEHSYKCPHWPWRLTVHASKEVMEVDRVVCSDGADIRGICSFVQGISTPTPHPGMPLGGTNIPSFINPLGVNCAKGRAPKGSLTGGLILRTGQKPLPTAPPHPRPCPPLR